MIARVQGSAIKHLNCTIITHEKGPCEACRLYRNNSLLRELHRLKEDVKSTDANSHTNYRFLSDNQKNERLKNLHLELRRKNRNLQVLQKAIKQLNEYEALPLSDNLSDDFSNLMSEYSATIEKKHDKNTFQYQFWKQQHDAASKSNKKSIRWHPLIIKWCLYLHHKSSGAYKTLRESGVILLPSGRTLRDYRHFAPAKAGFSTSYDQQLIDLAKATRPAELAKYLVLLVDEMYIKEGLVYNKFSGTLTGFVDLGDVDTHLSMYEAFSAQEGKKLTPRKLAKTIAVFMVNGLLTNLTFPYAVFPVSSLKAFHLFPLIWEVIGRLTRHNFQVLALTCDGASPNRKMFQMHGCTKQTIYKTTNIYSKNNDQLYFVADPPHLLKTIRNCFASSKRQLWVSMCYNNYTFTY